MSKHCKRHDTLLVRLVCDLVAREAALGHYCYRCGAEYVEDLPLETVGPGSPLTDSGWVQFKLKVDRQLLTDEVPDNLPLPKGWLPPKRRMMESIWIRGFSGVYVWWRNEVAWHHRPFATKPFIKD